MTLCRPYRNVPGYLLALTLVAICLDCTTVSGNEVAVKEESPPIGVSFTLKEITDALKLYNALRGNQYIADMRLMEWNVDLRKQAQSYVSYCDYNRTTPTFQGAETSVLRSMFYGSSSSTDVVYYKLKRDLKSLLYIDPNRNTDEGYNDLKKVNQAKTEHLGCSKKYCSSLSNHPKYKRGHIVACLHSPVSSSGEPLNWGDPCTKCPPGYKYCYAGLCTKREEYGQLDIGSTRYPNKSVVVAMVTAVTVWHSL